MRNWNSQSGFAWKQAAALTGSFFMEEQKWDKDTYRTTECKCPVCGHEIDAATSTKTMVIEKPTGAELLGRAKPPEARGPREGDLSVCLNCGEILVFDQFLQVAPASLNDVHELDAETNHILTRAQAYVRERGRIA